MSCAKLRLAIPMLATVLFVILTSMVQAANASSCQVNQPIRLADLSWESAQFSTVLYERLLRDGYGCSTERVPGSSAALESALAQDHLQIIPEMWSGRTEIIEKAIAAGQVQIVGETLEGGAEQGWYVPKYVITGDAERGLKPLAPDLHSVAQLSHYSTLFASPDKPAQGRFYNCPTGWVCETFNTRLFDLYGLSGYYDNFSPGTGAALDAAISSAYERREPILFYYWQPAGLMAKYDFHRLEAGAFKPECWASLLDKQMPACKSDFIRAKISVAVSTAFAQKHPDLLEMFSKVQLSPEQMNKIILAMSEQEQDATQLVQEFLLAYPEQWMGWLTPAAAKAVQDGLRPEASSSVSHFFPDWSFSTWTNRQLKQMVQRYSSPLSQFSAALLNGIILPLERLLQSVPAWALLALIAALTWHASRLWYASLLAAAAFYFIGALGLWDKLMQTFALVIVATLLSLLFGLPLGILSASSRWARRIMTPILDVMQTMPGFVYLIPVLMLFGLGKVPAVMATVIYAMPPLIRLTSLGLRQVDPQVLEAAQSYGVTPAQKLFRVTLPLARPSIMAGVNQSTMMALSMVVVASMIGAQGLGEDVLAGIQTQDMGRGLQAGLAIVVLAIVMDRITQFYGRSKRKRQRLKR